MPEWESKKLIKTSQYLFRSDLFWSVLICVYFFPDSDKITFVLEEAILCEVGLKLKIKLLKMDLFVTNMQLFTTQNINV